MQALLEAARDDMSDYGAVAIYLGLILAFAVTTLGVARVLRPRRPTAAKATSYECGAEPVGDAWVQFPVGFYLVALLFIVFDALAVFLFPWVLTLRDLGMWGLSAMLLFLAVLSLGWFYAYRERILEWQ
jgi:NADH-quinone oxidoreductase subunit A